MSNKRSLYYYILFCDNRQYGFYGRQINCGKARIRLICEKTV